MKYAPKTGRFISVDPLGFHSGEECLLVAIFDKK